MYLNKLEEERIEIVDHITQHQMRVKEIFDKRARPRRFMIGDMVLLWDKRRAPKGMHKKFDTLWKGPFKIQQAFENNSFKLAYEDGEVLPLTYNGQDLKLYQVIN